MQNFINNILNTLNSLVRKTETDYESTTKIIGQVKRNTDYMFGILTELTLNSIEDSNLATNIYFTAGQTINVTVPYQLEYIGALTFQPNTKYLINILNNVATINIINNQTAVDPENPETEQIEQITDQQTN